MTLLPGATFQSQIQPEIHVPIIPKISHSPAPSGFSLSAGDNYVVEYDITVILVSMFYIHLTSIESTRLSSATLVTTRSTMLQAVHVVVSHDHVVRYTH